MKYTLILGSTSPRRAELLKRLGFHFDIIGPEIDETPGRNEDPKKLVKRLSLGKAQAVQKIKFTPSSLILTADTVVVSPKNEILNKPVDAAEAQKMLRMLSGKVHKVYTGYCLLTAKQKIQRVIESKVQMRTLSKASIQTYIQTTEPMDKAGGYGAQGMGLAFIQEIRGSHTNVIGLPLEAILDDLYTSFRIKPLSWL
jgi:septum formation protein